MHRAAGAPSAVFGRTGAAAALPSGCECAREEREGDGARRCRTTRARERLGGASRCGPRRAA
eukprot:365526-Chlamydomonas_euryale.AAC.4